MKRYLIGSDTAYAPSDVFSCFKCKEPIFITKPEAQTIDADTTTLCVSCMPQFDVEYVVTQSVLDQLSKRLGRQITHEEVLTVVKNLVEKQRSMS